MRHSCFFDGYDAFALGEPLDENPECPGQPHFWAWRDGWLAAERGEVRPPEPKPLLPQRWEAD